VSNRINVKLKKRETSMRNHTDHQYLFERFVPQELHEKDTANDRHDTGTIRIGLVTREIWIGYGRSCGYICRAFYYMHPEDIRKAEGQKDGWKGFDWKSRMHHLEILNSNERPIHTIYNKEFK
jgi:hypothetical protein